jgi:hypothetical protein
MELKNLWQFFKLHSFNILLGGDGKCTEVPISSAFDFKAGTSWHTYNNSTVRMVPIKLLSK